MSFALLQGMLAQGGQLQGRGTAVEGQSQQNEAHQLALYRVCSTDTEIGNTIQLNGSANFSIGADGIDSKVRWVKELHLTDQEVAIVVYSSVTAEYMSPDARLRENPLPNGVSKDWKNRPVVRKRDSALFHDSYGDRFIYQAKRGREFIGCYRCSSHNTQSKEQLAVNLSSHLAVFGGKLAAGIDSSLETYMQQNQISKVGSYLLNGADTVGFPDPDHLVQFALEFPGKIAGLTDQGQVMLGLETRGYEMLGLQFE